MILSVAVPADAEGVAGVRGFARGFFQACWFLYQRWMCWAIRFFAFVHSASVIVDVSPREDGVLSFSASSVIFCVS